jgi:thioredoxin-related protein
VKSALFILLCASFLFGIEGEKVYENKCAACHQDFISMSKLKENFLDHNNTLLKLTAPTLNQLSYRLKQRIGDPKGDNEIHRMEVTAFISDYVFNPDRDKSVCLPDVMQHFKTMSSLKGQVTEDELEAVSIFIYDFDTKTIKKKSVQYEGFDKALEKAEKEDKIIMIKVMSKECHFCRKMDAEVMIEEEVVQALEKDFVSVEIDVSTTTLPWGLKVDMTPSFIFIDKTGKVISNVPGSWKKKDFLEILEEVKDKTQIKR